MFKGATLTNIASSGFSSQITYKTEQYKKKREQYRLKYTCILIKQVIKFYYFKKNYIYHSVTLHKTHGDITNQ